jgi:YfiH family protein
MREGIMEKDLKIDDFKAIRRWSDGKIYSPSLRNVSLECGRILPLLYFPELEAGGMFRTGFTTRIGGFSRGCCASMNISYDQCDDPWDVDRNVKLAAEAMGSSPSKMVYTEQQHTTNVRVVTEHDAGRGTVRPRVWESVDGLVTDVPGLVLTAFGSDCTTLYFVDPEHKAIGLSHAGWRGTVAGMAEKTLLMMKQEYGTDPKDVLAAVGPSICRSCYEIGQDVADEVRRLQPNFADEVLDDYPDNKFRLDLHMLNKLIMERAGVPADHIFVTDICTRCNPELLFSHRIMGSQRGNNAAMLMLVPEDKK